MILFLLCSDKAILVNFKVRQYKQMKKSLNKILAGLTLLILIRFTLPSCKYTRINENEELITSVYKEQLETIISSVNYYSEDIMSNWAGRIDVWMMHPSDSTVLKLLTSENSSILAIYAAQRSTDLNTIYSSGNEKQHLVSPTA